MSHTANLRNRYRPSQPETGNKRRRTEDSTPKVNGVTHQANGVIPQAKLTAQPTKQAKSSQHAPSAESTAKITQPDADEDVEMADSGSESGNASSSEESEDDEDDEDLEDGGAALASGGEDESEDSDAKEDTDISNKSPTDPIPDKPTTAGTDDATLQETDDEPTFADLLKARGASPINIAVSDPTTSQPPDTLTPTTSTRTLTAPTATSLGTVLTQALRTNDIDLLESCFQVPNLESIRATIERLHSSHATTLLQRLAERLHKRPGRAGSLMVWVQWTVVAHGGYLARQPAAMRELQTLHHVVKQRATGLQPLLALKGKLDMLEAQMQLRRNMQARTRARHPGAGEGVTYVEGEEESSSEEEDGGKGGRVPAVIGRTGTVSTDPRPKKGKARKREPLLKRMRKGEVENEESSDDDMEDDMPSTMPDAAGVDGFEDFGDLADEDSEDDDADLIDDEAEETDQDSDALSEDIDYDDVDEASGSDEEEEPEEEQRPKKRSKQ